MVMARFAAGGGATVKLQDLQQSKPEPGLVLNRKVKI